MSVALPLPLWRFPAILLRACQMPDQAWAAALGLPLNSAAAWLDGELPAAEPVNHRLLTLHAVLTALGRTYSGAQMGSWMSEPQEQLGDLRPVDWIGADQDLDTLLLLARHTAAAAHGIGPDSSYWPR